MDSWILDVCFENGGLQISKKRRQRCAGEAPGPKEGFGEQKSGVSTSVEVAAVGGRAAGGLAGGPADACKTEVSCSMGLYDCSMAMTMRVGMR